MSKFSKIGGREMGKYDVLDSTAVAILDTMVDCPEKKLAEYALYYANQQRLDAGFSGAMNDGGASHTEQIVEAWISGLRQRVPKALAYVAAAYNRDTDPEYANYLKLKEKFGE